MTYRKKLLLKRLAIILAVAVVAILLFLILGFSYMGRYVVYTEDGAHFSFNTQDGVSIEEGLNILPPENPVLITGTSILEAEGLTNEDIIRLSADEVNGLLVSYETLSDGSTLNAIDFTEENYNMLILEMRTGSSDILNTEPVLTLIERARDQHVKLAAMISCLDDSTYAKDHIDRALPLESGALWMNDSDSYWLDPANRDVQKYITEMILSLADMGFQEVILNNFYFPESQYIDYSSEKSREELLIEAYEAIEDDVGIRCTLGILVTDPENGHQALDYAEHLYVYYSGGGKLAGYISSHPDQYIVFVTASHDTRFDDYGKIIVDNEEASFIPEQTGSSTTTEPETDEYDEYTE